MGETVSSKTPTNICFRGSKISTDIPQGKNATDMVAMKLFSTSIQRETI